MTKKLLFFSMLVCFAFSTMNTFSQVSAFNIGWNASHLFTPLKNLQNDIDAFNTLNPAMEKQYNIPQWFQGLYIDYRIGSPEAGMIMGWNNKHGIAEAEGIVAVRSRIRNPQTTDCYLVFQMRYLEGMPRPDGKEVDAAEYLRYEEIEALNNVVNLTKIIIQQHNAKKLTTLSRTKSFEFYNSNDQDYQLFL